MKRTGTPNYMLYSSPANIEILSNDQDQGAGVSGLARVSPLNFELEVVISKPNLKRVAITSSLIYSRIFS